VVLRRGKARLLFTWEAVGHCHNMGLADSQQCTASAVRGNETRIGAGLCQLV
jgi:hypothetical protein